MVLVGRSLRPSCGARRALLLRQMTHSNARFTHADACEAGRREGPRMSVVTSQKVREEVREGGSLALIGCKQLVEITSIADRMFWTP